jgi:hypothetical protein
MQNLVHVNVALHRTHISHHMAAASVALPATPSPYIKRLNWIPTLLRRTSPSLPNKKRCPTATPSIVLCIERLIEHIGNQQYKAKSEARARLRR